MREPASTSDAEGRRLARLLIDPPQSGPWNMALDQALLEAVDASPEIVLRFYQWSEPTLSLGYFQTLASRSEHPASRGAAIVRRASGGGAILHDRELTYSLVMPAARRATKLSDSRQAGALYRLVHQSLIAILAEQGISARPCELETAVGGNQPFLCFERRSAGDVLLGGHKIAGSAQRRYRGAVLQHGSVLLGRSASAPELPGIAELAQIELSAERLTALWLPRLTRALGLSSQSGAITSSEATRAELLAAGRYGSREWTALK